MARGKKKGSTWLTFLACMLAMPAAVALLDGIVADSPQQAVFAGALLGFAIADAALIADLEKLKYSTNPYNINQMTMAAGIGVMEDEAYTRANCRTIMDNRAYAAAELTKLGFVMNCLPFLTPLKRSPSFISAPARVPQMVVTASRGSSILIAQEDSRLMVAPFSITTNPNAQSSTVNLSGSQLPQELP